MLLEKYRFTSPTVILYFITFESNESRPGT